MGQISFDRSARPFPASDLTDRAAYGLILGLGALLFWLSHAHPALMPFWAPWDFSPTIYLATACAAYWYGRGLALTPQAERPGLWRRVSFFLGLMLIYGVLQTRVEYWSQHMFFLNRLQNDVMHDFGPFFIALAWPGETLTAGMPLWVRRLVASRPVAALGRIVHQPLVGGILFVGSYCLWLIPVVHFRAMIDPQLYALMNASMVLGGLLFWGLVLDPRPTPPARSSYAVRIALAIAVMFPTVLVGALIAFMPIDLYPYYDLCGRLFPAIGPISDQQIGGIIIWIPPGILSLIAVLLVLNFLRLHDDRKAEHEHERSAFALASQRPGR